MGNLEAFKIKTTEQLTGLQNDVKDRDSTISDLRVKLANSTSPAEMIRLQRQIDQLTTQQTKDNTTISDLKGQLQTLTDQIKQLNTDWANKLSAVQKDFQEFRDRNKGIYEAIAGGLAVLLAALVTWRVRARNSLVNAVVDYSKDVSKVTDAARTVAGQKIDTQASQAMLSALRKGLGYILQLFKGDSAPILIKAYQKDNERLEGEMKRAREKLPPGQELAPLTQKRWTDQIDANNLAIASIRGVKEAANFIANPPVAAPVAPAAAPVAPAAETPAAEKTPPAETPAAAPAEPAVAMGFTQQEFSNFDDLQSQLANNPDNIRAAEQAIEDGKRKVAEVEKTPANAVEVVDEFGKTTPGCCFCRPPSAT